MSNRRRPLSRAKLWTLADGGVQTEACREYFDVIETRSVRADNLVALDKWWNVIDRESLFTQLAWLRDGGHGLILQREIEVLTDKLSSATNTSRLQLTLKERIISAKLPVLKQSKFLAWDQCRLINLARWGLNCGYISEDEAWRWMARAALRLRNEMTSWADVAADFAVGYHWWSGEKDEPAFLEENYKRLIRPGCPWSMIAWGIDPRELEALHNGEDAAASSSASGDRVTGGKSKPAEPPNFSRSARLEDAAALLDKGADWTVVRSCFKGGEKDALRFAAYHFAQKYPNVPTGLGDPVYRVKWKKAYRSDKKISLLQRITDLALGRMKFDELTFDTYHSSATSTHEHIRKRLRSMKQLRLNSLLFCIIGGLGGAAVIGSYFDLSKKETLEDDVVSLFFFIPLVICIVLCLCGIGAAIIAQKMKRTLPFGLVGKYGFAPTDIAEVDPPEY